MSKEGHVVKEYSYDQVTWFRERPSVMEIEAVRMYEREVAVKEGHDREDESDYEWNRRKEWRDGVVALVSELNRVKRLLSSEERERVNRVLDEVLGEEKPR